MKIIAKALIVSIYASRINELLQMQLGKSLHVYKKVAANQGVLFDSVRRNEVRRKLRTQMEKIKEYSYGVYSKS